MLTQPSRRDFIKQTCALVVASGAALRTTRAADAKFVVGETSFGKIRGVEVEGIKIFKGVPYGASTAGTNRFMPPANPAKWAGVRDALEFGPSAPQTEPGTRRAASSLAVAAA
ncbi:MAG: carboxylesterase/lipase family protein, partial [Blastocatellia bacterium]